MASQDYYEILGVSRRAKPREIEKAYLKLARKYHPDVNPGDQQSKERFQLIQEAYDVLSDPKKRAAYDRGEVYEEPTEKEAGKSLGRLAEVIFEGFDAALGERAFEDVVKEPRVRWAGASSHLERPSAAQHQLSAVWRERKSATRLPDLWWRGFGGACSYH
jgi:DnaJ-class molecular chaperone